MRFTRGKRVALGAVIYHSFACQEKFNHRITCVVGEERHDVVMVLQIVMSCKPVSH